MGKLSKCYLKSKILRKWANRLKIYDSEKNGPQGQVCFHLGARYMYITPRGGTLIFCGYIGEATASTPKPKKLLRFADHPKKIPVLSGIPKKILELLAYPKKLHVFIFFMPIDEILSHPYDLSCWWDVKSQIN